MSTSTKKKFKLVKFELVVELFLIWVRFLIEEHVFSILFFDYKNYKLIGLHTYY
jgi:hypothetical protein